MDIKNEILKYNTRNGVEPKLSPWFSSMLDEQIKLGIFSGKISSLICSSNILENQGLNSGSTPFRVLYLSISFFISL